MAFSQYPDNIAVVIQTGPDTPGGDQIIPLGPIETSSNRQLEVYRLQIFKRGLQPLVQMFLRAYIGNDLIGESQIVRVSDIEAKYAATENFYGWIAFNFAPRINCTASVEVHFNLVLLNYNYQADDSVYIAGVLDWPITMGYNPSPGSVNDAPFAIELYGAE